MKPFAVRSALFALVVAAACSSPKRTEDSTPNEQIAPPAQPAPTKVDGDASVVPPPPVEGTNPPSDTPQGTIVHEGDDTRVAQVPGDAGITRGDAGTGARDAGIGRDGGIGARDAGGVGDAGAPGVRDAGAGAPGGDAGGARVTPSQPGPGTGPTMPPGPGTGSAPPPGSPGPTGPTTPGTPPTPTTPPTSPR